MAAGHRRRWGDGSRSTRGWTRPQLGELVEEEKWERHPGVEPVGRLGAPVRHGALVERAAQRGAAGPSRSQARPEPLADGQRAADPVLVEPVAPVGAAVGDGAGAQGALAGLGGDGGLVDDRVRVVERASTWSGSMASSRFRVTSTGRSASQALQPVEVVGQRGPADRARPGGRSSTRPRPGGWRAAPPCRCGAWPGSAGSAAPEHAAFLARWGRPAAPGPDRCAWRRPHGRRSPGPPAVRSSTPRVVAPQLGHLGPQVEPAPLAQRLQDRFDVAGRPAGHRAPGRLVARAEQAVPAEELDKRPRRDLREGLGVGRPNGRPEWDQVPVEEPGRPAAGGQKVGQGAGLPFRVGQQRCATTG